MAALLHVLLAAILLRACASRRLDDGLSTKLQLNDFTQTSLQSKASQRQGSRLFGISGPFKKEIIIHLENAAGFDFELVGPGQHAGKEGIGKKKAGLAAAVKAGGLTGYAIAGPTAAKLAIAAGKDWVAGFLGASGFLSDKALVLLNAGGTILGAGMAAGLAAYWLASIVNTELLQLGRDNAGSFWFKKGRLKEPFLENSMIYAGSEGDSEGEYIRLAGSGWSGVGGWLRFREIGPDGDYTQRYLSISFSNYLRDKGCKFFAHYGKHMDGTSMYRSRSTIGPPGTEEAGHGVSWLIRSQSSRRCVFDLRIEPAYEPDEPQDEKLERLEAACRDKRSGWFSKTMGECLCQKLSDKYDVAYGMTYGSATPEAVEWWQLNECETSPRVCAAFGCSCQGASDHCQSSLEKPDGSHSCPGVGQWFQTMKCETVPGGYWLQVFSDKLNEGFQFINSLTGEVLPLRQPPSQFAPACAAMGVCEEDCKSDRDCWKVCQKMADKYDIIVGLTWGSASEDVQAYWELKCSSPSFVRNPPQPRICRDWDCSCHAARYDHKLNEDSDVVEWADEFCWTLPLPDLVLVELDDRELSEAEFAEFSNVGVNPEGGLQLLDEGKAMHKVGSVDSCLRKCMRTSRCIAAEYLEPSGRHRDRCNLFQWGPERQCVGRRHVHTIDDLIQGGREYDAKLDKDFPKGFWTTFVLHTYDDEKQNVLPYNLEHIWRRPSGYGPCDPAANFCNPGLKSTASSGPCCFPTLNGSLAVFDCSPETSLGCGVGNWIQNPLADPRRCMR